MHSFDIYKQEAGKEKLQIGSRHLSCIQRKYSTAELEFILALTSPTLATVAILNIISKAFAFSNVVITEITQIYNEVHISFKDNPNVCNNKEKGYFKHGNIYLKKINFYFYFNE